MSLSLYAQVGARESLGDGTENIARSDKTGALVTHELHGVYYEESARGQTFFVSTPVAGVAPGTALSTTPPMCLWNPPGSKVEAAVLVSSVSYISGTLGAGSIVYAYVSSQPSAPTGGTALTPVAGNLSAASGAIKAFQGSTVASTPAILFPTGWTMGAALATTAAFPSQCLERLDGLITIAPGTCLVMQAVAAAGTSPLVLFGLSYNEIAIK